MITKKYSKAKGCYKVTFSLTQEQVGENRDVRVLADFNDWSWINGIPMKATKGKYSGSIELPAQTALYQFRYLVDGSQWMNDPEADRYQGNVHGTTNCVFELEGVAAPAEQLAVKKPVVKKPAAKKVAAKKPAAKKAAPAKKETAKAAAPAKKAATKKPAVKKSTAKADDLKRIEGIGPKIAGLLNEAGITTFEGLSDAPAKKLNDVLEAAGPRFRLAKPDTWQQQAMLAAAGKEVELKQLQAKLKGGVKK